MKNFLSEAVSTPPLAFVDREEIRSIIMDECEHKMQKHDYFKVIAVYGIGGIGKTRLIEKIKETIKQSSYNRKIVHISFEINKNSQCLDNLIKIRKAFSSCSIFDYALLSYWDHNRTEQLNHDFMNVLKSGFTTNLVDMLGEIAVGIVPTMASVPSISNIFECVNKLMPKIKNCKYKRILEDIPGLSSEMLLDKMPLYLGMDIQRQFDKNSDIPIIFIFDSYQQSQPYAESQEWLLKLISTISQGLFLITGREELQWEKPNDKFIIYPLKAFPEDEARRLLESSIPKENRELIDTIIESTQCVPIYVDLAIKVYKSELIANPQSLVNKSLFSDRNLLVRQFINHMPSNWQEVLIDLSVIRVFNQDIFNYLVKDQNLPCPITDYEKITQVSLINYVENTDELSKIHDVFCKNGRKILSPTVKLTIFKSYLCYLSQRAIHQDSSLSSVAMSTLFLNVLSLESQLSKDKRLEVDIWERTLDMFFFLYDIKVTFTPPEPSSEYTNDYNDLLYLIGSINHKSIPTLKSVELFESIKNPKNFGKHEKSFLLLWKYAASLLGKYDEWHMLLEDMNSQLTENDQGEWYNTRTTLYLADFWIMEGAFIKAHTALQKMKNYMEVNYLSEEHALLIYRYIGHLYRFNFFCEDAADKYKDIFNHMQDTLSLTLYIKTNLCETYCYFFPEYFEDNFEDTLVLAQQLRHIKNIGKLYYSRAIARTVSGNWAGAQCDIAESLKINREDGYQSGELFAYMAQAYLDYALDGFVHKETEGEIMDLIHRNKVYQYFALPLSIMTGDELGINAQRCEYEWLDFDFTVVQYKKFFKSLQKQE